MLQSFSSRQRSFRCLWPAAQSPQQRTAKLATRSTPFHNPNFWKPANPKTWEKIHQRQTDDVDVDLETRSTPFHNPKFWRPNNPKDFQKIHQRAAPISTSVSVSTTATATPVYPFTNSTATATASATPTPADDVSSADTIDPSNDPFAADEDLVWVDDEDEDSYYDKREDKSSNPATDDDSEDDVVFHYLYDEPEAPTPAPEADKKDVVSKREVDYDEDLDYLFDAGTTAEDI